MIHSVSVSKEKRVLFLQVILWFMDNFFSISFENWKEKMKSSVDLQ